MTADQIPETVVEAVARAICVACEENPDSQGDARGNEFRWQDYRDAALAAISALTAAQQQGGGDVVCPECYGEGGRRWYEANGSERGERCGTCGGFGHIAAPPSAPAGVKTLSEFMAEQEALHPGIHDKVQAAADELRTEVVRPKREDECLTLDHWRMRAYALEENWSRCSRACAVEQTKREQAEARAKRLAEALRLAEEHINALTPEWYSAGQRVLAEIRAALAEESSND